MKPDRQHKPVLPDSSSRTASPEQPLHLSIYWQSLSEPRKNRSETCTTSSVSPDNASHPEPSDQYARSVRLMPVLPLTDVYLQMKMKQNHLHSWLSFLSLHQLLSHRQDIFPPHLRGAGHNSDNALSFPQLIFPKHRAFLLVKLVNLLSHSVASYNNSIGNLARWIADNTTAAKANSPVHARILLLEVLPQFTTLLKILRCS